MPAPPPLTEQPDEKGVKPVISVLKEVKQLLDSSQVATSLRVSGPVCCTIPEITQPIPVKEIKAGAKSLKGIKTKST